jgi:hypothetical protein
MQNVNILETDLTGQNVLIFVRYSSMDNGLPSSNQFRFQVKKKANDIPTTLRGGPKICETSRLSHFVDNLLTNVSKLVSFTRRPFNSRKIPGSHFC